MGKSNNPHSCGIGEIPRSMDIPVSMELFYALYDLFTSLKTKWRFRSFSGMKAPLLIC
jgi:hypothetical protein